MTGGRVDPLSAGLRAGNEGLWAVALAGFLLHATVGRPFPVAAGAAAFSAAAVLARALEGRPRRRVSVLAAHAAGLTACLAWGLHRDGPVGGWLPSAGDWGAWGWWVQSAFWLGLLWVKGASFSKNPGTHERVCVQFDKGVAAFGVIFLSGLVLQARWGYTAEWRPAPFLFFLFFVTSVAAMGRALPAGRVKASADPFDGPRPVLALAFPVLIWALGAGAVRVFMPFLRTGAQAGLEVLETTTSPLGPVVVRILKFIFAHRQTPSMGEASPGGGGIDPAPGAADMEASLLDQVLGWGLAGVLGAVLAASAAAVLVFALKALLARTRMRRGPGAPGSPGSLLARLRRWLVRIRRCSPAAVLRALRDPGPVRLYARLIGWGTRSGLPRRPAETPLEYGARLSGRFLHLSGDILLIVDLVSRELYAETGPGADRRRQGLLAWRRLRSPANWRIRIQTLLSPEDPFAVTSSCAGSPRP
jgi:hypothetical protein